MGKSKLILIAVALLAVVGGVFWYQTKNKQGLTLPPGEPSVSDQEPGSSAIVLEGGNAINVENQEGGETVAIDLVVFESPGFVVIHKADKNSKPGEVVGHSELLAKGQNKEVVVEIDTPAAKGGVYFAMLHEDTDQDKDFGSVEDDLPVKDKQGNVIMMKFTITSDAALSEE